MVCACEMTHLYVWHDVHCTTLQHTDVGLNDTTLLWRLTTVTVTLVIVYFADDRNQVCIPVGCSVLQSVAVCCRHL